MAGGVAQGVGPEFKPSTAKKKKKKKIYTGWAVVGGAGAQVVERVPALLA
jgi:hypothetical protein